MQAATRRQVGTLGLLAVVAGSYLAPIPAVAADAPESPYNCDSTQARSPSADLVITLDPATSWQPRGGHLRIVVESSTQALKDTDVHVCFRWSRGDDNTARYLPPSRVQVVEFNAAKAVYSVAVPDALERVSSSWFERLQLWGKLPESTTQPTNFDNGKMVPVADVKVIVGKSNAVLATETLRAGITSVWTAILTTLVCVLGAHALILVWARQRKVPGHSLWMRLVSTRDGYASLSQLQIMLWSFVFGAGVVYVMCLSGTLINVPVTALVLLGIAGATTLGAKIQGANAQAAPPPTTDLPAADAIPTPPANVRAIASTDHSVTLAWDQPAAGAVPGVYAVSYARQDFADWKVSDDRIKQTSHRVVRLSTSTSYVFQVVAQNAKGSSQPVQVSAQTKEAAVIPREPLWSDLVVTQQHPGEIDVTRVQMLFFTFISAAFVAIKLINSYMIPEIPDGFMLLMGISNGVYLSAKFVRD